MKLGRLRMLQVTQRAAAVVQSDPVRKPGPGKAVGLLDVMQELDQLVGSRTHFFHFGRLLDGIEVVAHVVHAAAGGRHDIIEA